MQQPTLQETRRILVLVLCHVIKLAAEVANWEETAKEAKHNIFLAI
jgi:hypothetical protein